MINAKDLLNKNVKIKDSQIFKVVGYKDDIVYLKSQNGKILGSVKIDCIESVEK